MFNVICTVSVIYYYGYCDHPNMQVYVVIFTDSGICMVTFVIKFYTGGYFFGYIRPMLNFLMMRLSP